MMGAILPFARVAPATASMTDADNAPLPEHPDGLSDDLRWAGLMVMAQDGDKEAYRALLMALTPHLRAITRRYLGRGEDAEDALQDVLMIVHGIRHTYERNRPFKPWLNTIASRRCIDLLRRRAHRLQHEMADDEDIGHHPHAGHGPEETLLRAHEASRVHDAVASLPPRQREAVSMLRLQELSLNEAADHSKQSVGSLKVACHRAMASLHNALAKKEPPHA
jgi:RNA polymerase sigma factor (sigma-70 family)